MDNTNEKLQKEAFINGLYNVENLLIVAVSEVADTENSFSTNCAIMGDGLLLISAIVNSMQKDKLFAEMLLKSCMYFMTETTAYNQDQSTVGVDDTATEFASIVPKTLQ